MLEVVRVTDSFPPEVIHNQLQRVLASRSFGHAKRLHRVLSHMVEAALAGQRDLDEYSIGVDALEKAESFDPRVDPSVRVHTRRLRLKLKTYYQSDGRDDALVIDLPPRTYVPTFRMRSRLPVARASADSAAAAKENRLAILPFASLSTWKEDENFANGLTQEVIHALMRLADVQLVVCERPSSAIFTDAFDVGRRAKAQAVLQGTVRIAEGHARISAELVSVQDGSVFWSNMYENSILAKQLIATQELAAVTIGHGVQKWLTAAAGRASAGHPLES